MSLSLMDLTRSDRDLYYADKGRSLAYLGHFCPDCGHPTLTLISIDEALTCSLCADQIRHHTWHDHQPI